MIEFVAGLCFVAAAVFAVLWWRARATAESVGIDRDAVEHSRAGMAAVLATVPVAGYRWRRDGGEKSLGSCPAPPPACPTTAFWPGSTARMRRGSTPRSTSCAAAAHRSPPPCRRLTARPMRSRAARRRAATASCGSPTSRRSGAPRRRAPPRRPSKPPARDAGALPLPVWRRDGGLRIVDCNTAFAAAVDQPREAVLAAPSELAPDNEQGRRRRWPRRRQAGRRRASDATS